MKVFGEFVQKHLWVNLDEKYRQKCFSIFVAKSVKFQLHFSAKSAVASVEYCVLKLTSSHHA